MQLWFRAGRLPDGWFEGVRIVVKDGEISSVQTGVEPAAADQRHGPVVPGLSNLHSHAFQRAMAGRAEKRGQDRDNFWSWRSHMYRLAEIVRPEDLESIAALAYAEMLEGGFVRVGEFHYVHHDLGGAAFSNPAEMAVSLAAAAAATGVGLTLLPVLYTQSGFGGRAPTEGQRRFVHDLDGFARLLEACRGALAPLDDANLGVAPHSLRAVSPDILAAVTSLVPEGPIHIHVAEQAQEVADCLAWSGQRPVEWLLNNQPIDGRWCLVHATHLEGAELERAAGSGAVVGLCPITEANLGDGIFPAAEWLGHGGRFGIGSDSNVLIDPAEELRLLEYGQRLYRRERNVLSSTTGQGTADGLHAAAVAGGAQALGVRADGLTPGAAATFVTLDDDHPSLRECPADEVVDRWVFAARAPAVDCVWVRGRKLVAGGRHQNRDTIRARYRETLKRLQAASGG
jgi:formimidoylglutamate deiminase